MRPRIPALLLGACALVALIPGLRSQGLPNNQTVTSGSSPVVQANQTIQTNGTVTINASTSVTFQAANTITLQNGFTATAGSNFHAFLTTPDFVINVTPTSGGTTLAGAATTYSVTVSSIFNFTGTVYFSAAGVTGLPQGASASFSASSITPPVDATSTPSPSPSPPPPASPATTHSPSLAPASAIPITWEQAPYWCRILR
jgi:hypothetical protein